MSSANRKRKESPSASLPHSASTPTREEEAPLPKKLYLGEEERASVMAEEIDAAVLNRPPLVVSLKRVGKRVHLGVEKMVDGGADGEGSEETAARRQEAAAAPPPRKVAIVSQTPVHSASYASSRQSPMASNLRASLRGSNGNVGQKQVKKLVVKSSLGTHAVTQFPLQFGSFITQFPLSFSSLQLLLTSLSILIHRGTQDTRELPRNNMAEAQRGRGFDPSPPSRLVLPRRALYGTLTPSFPFDFLIFTSMTSIIPFSPPHTSTECQSQC